MTKEQQKAYRQTESGKAAMKRYALSQKAKAAAKRYRDSGKWSIARQRYRDSEKGQASDTVYRDSHREEYQLKDRAKRADLKSQCVEYLGGACMICGLKDECTAVYDFHHRDPGAKDYNVAHAMRCGRLSFDELKDELDKCDLICTLCHRRLHAKSDCCRRPS